MFKPIRSVFLAALLILIASCGSVDSAKPIAKESANNQSPKAAKKVHVKIDEQMISKAKEYFDIMIPLDGEIYGSHDQYVESMSKISRQQRLLVAIDWYLAEVNNGGHSQFYLNPSGLVWEDALAGFREFGFPEFAKVVEDSAKRMGGKPSFNREAREEQFKAKLPDFKDLDKHLYDLEEDYDEEHLEFARKHSREPDYEAKLTEFKRTHIP